MIYESILFKAETPIHMGADAKLGIVDNPIQREEHTNFPKLPASGIKGSIRSEFKEDIVDYIFGDEGDNKHRSLYSFTDGRILFFPVKSARNVFAWVTCPYVLNSFIEDCKMFGIYETLLENIKSENMKIQPVTHITGKGNTFIDRNKARFILEELSYSVDNTIDKGGYKELKNLLLKALDGIVDITDKPDDKSNNKSYDKSQTQQDVFIVSDSDFKYFVELGTEVNTRIRIGESGVVEDGALFTEEYIPEETIFYGFIGSDKGLQGDNDKDKRSIEVLNEYKDKPFTKLKKQLGIIKNQSKTGLIQLGGNFTLGKGFTTVKITELKDEEK